MLNRCTESAPQQLQNLVNGVCTNYITQKPQVHGNSPNSNASLTCFELYLNYFRHLEEHYVTIPGFENTWWELEPLWSQERKQKVQGSPALRSFTKMLFSSSLCKQTQTLQESRHRKKTKAVMSKPGILGWWVTSFKKKKKKNVILEIFNPQCLSVLIIEKRGTLLT